MTSRVPYDDFADIYDAWCASAPITEKNGAFYVRKLVESPGPRVELGVGNGRICVEVAKRGKPITGVDSSIRILELARTRAREAGVEERLDFIHADFRDFVLQEPAELVVLPFHTIGHLLGEADKLQALCHVRSQLREGGRFIFDHFLFDPDFVVPGVPYLRAEFRHPESGRNVVLWEASTRDLERRIIRILAWTDELDEKGVVLERRYRRSALSWLSPGESEKLLKAAGFEIVSHYGDFDENPPGEGSTHQVWVARVR
jgi:ubiquinone/menaquinone biosynthesis C-methylase UbiE